MSGNIYIIRQDNHYKVGFSNDPLSRMSDLQVGSPFKLEMIHRARGSKYDEKFIHRLFQRWRVRGEWFALPDWLVSDIRGISPHSKKPIGRALTSFVLMGPYEYDD